MTMPRMTCTRYLPSAYDLGTPRQSRANQAGRHAIRDRLVAPFAARRLATAPSHGSTPLQAEVPVHGGESSSAIADAGTTFRAVHASRYRSGAGFGSRTSSTPRTTSKASSIPTLRKPASRCRCGEFEATATGIPADRILATSSSAPGRGAARRGSRSARGIHLLAELLASVRLDVEGVAGPRSPGSASPVSGWPSSRWPSSRWPSSRWPSSRCRNRCWQEWVTACRPRLRRGRARIILTGTPSSVIWTGWFARTWLSARL
jgi:hypothetical protein